MHAHDWPTAPVCFGNLASARSVFTIHNLNYGADLIGRAMSGAAVGTTVSPTYAAEVSPMIVMGCWSGLDALQAIQASKSTSGTAQNGWQADMPLAAPLPRGPGVVPLCVIRSGVMPTVAYDGLGFTDPSSLPDQRQRPY